MPYTLPNLPYDYTALEPHIDAQTMQIHHSKHHAAYVTNLNKALEGAQIQAPECIYQLLAQLDTLPESIRMAIRNNGGGHANHSFFWPLLTPGGKKQPTDRLSALMTKQFGSFEALQEQFAAAALSRFGSGWAWLGVLPDGTLSIGSTPNQDHPCMKDAHYRGWPILGLDVWEHAYYLKYQNRRADYINAFWAIINWDQVDAYYEMGVNYFSGKKEHSCSSKNS